MEKLSWNERVNYQIITIDLALVVEWSWALPSGTQIIGSITEGEQKVHKYTGFARSALCTGNYD